MSTTKNSNPPTIQRYSVSLTFIKQFTAVQHHCVLRSVVVNAFSKEEALGKAILATQKTVDDEYLLHQFGIVRIEDAKTL